LAFPAAQMTHEWFTTASQSPAAKVHQVCDSLASVRGHKGTEPILVLGLDIAKLIRDFHQAEMTAQNHTAPTASVAFVIEGAALKK